MNKRVIVLGGGMVGSTIAIELSKQYDVTVVDLNDSALAKMRRCFGISCVKADVLDRKKMDQLLSPFDLVIGAVPGELGFDTVKRVIEAGKNMVDISFFPEDPFELDDRAKHKKVTVAVDAGIAPGISNMILGYHYNNMKVDSYECVVGGLPIERQWPWEYKAGFSPSDVIAEYVRPARFMEHGNLITKEAMSGSELIEFEGVGTLEAWNSDGLRTLLKTVKVPNMIEKTLRYPGTIEYLKVLMKSGFFSQKTIDVKGCKVRPIDVTSQLLMPMWELKKGEEDFTVMRAKVQGHTGKEVAVYEYNLFDKFDQKSGIHSMSRTTGYTCSAISELMLNGSLKDHGIIAPEVIAQQEGLFAYVISYLEDRGIKFDVDRTV